MINDENENKVWSAKYSTEKLATNKETRAQIVSACMHRKEFWENVSNIIFEKKKIKNHIFDESLIIKQNVGAN